MGDNCDLDSIDKALENEVFSFNPNSALLYRIYKVTNQCFKKH